MQDDADLQWFGMKYVPLVIPNFQKTNVFDLYSKTDVVGKNHNEKKALF